MWFNWEHATFFYKKNKKYAYYKPWTDKKPTSVDVSSVVNKHKSKYKIIATAHTHPYVPGYDGENFSDADKTGAKIRKLNSYLVTPSGKIKSYN